MKLRWSEVAAMALDDFDGTMIEIEGVPSAAVAGLSAGHFVLLPEATCCPGCVPRDALAAVEVFARQPMPLHPRPTRLRGVWQTQRNGDWRYAVRDAVTTDPPGWTSVTRRRLVSAGPLMCLAAFGTTVAPASRAAAQRVMAGVPTVDMHSHAGAVNSTNRIRRGQPFDPVAPMMRAGGMAAICLAIVSDGPTHRMMSDGRLHPYRDPAPGELYEYGQLAFQRVNEMARDQDLAVIRDRGGIRAAKAGTPSVIVTAEGADFLEGRPDRVDEAYARWSLRHLQLTHYRVNELGDIQTESPVHGGLTELGATVIRRCNALGIVVDVAHGTYDLVKQAASVTTRPLILSHTSLSNNPGPFSRQIHREHARVIAATGGVVGVWPPATIYYSLTAMAAGMMRMADAIGVDHVGLGSDMRGLPGASVFPDYEHLPALADELLDAGCSTEDAGKILGGNYVRVFEATVS